MINPITSVGAFSRDSHHHNRPSLNLKKRRNRPGVEFSKDLDNALAVRETRTERGGGIGDCRKARSVVLITESRRIPVYLTNDTIEEQTRHEKQPDQDRTL